MPIDHRFPELDEEINWYSAHVAGSHQVLFRMPAWPYPLWPKANNAEILYNAILRQVPEPVRKSMNAAHSVFDPSSEAAETAAVEVRKWKYVMLDFSKVKGIGELSSKVLYSDAGDKEALDYDLIEIPTSVNQKGQVLALQTFLGFRVGCIDDSGGRKIARSGAKKSKLQQKREAAAASRLNQMKQG